MENKIEDFSQISGKQLHDFLNLISQSRDDVITVV